LTKQGALFYNKIDDRYYIRFGLDSFSYELHCGDGMEVLIDNKWISTRIEKGQRWYLVDIGNYSIDSLIVRVPKSGELTASEVFS